MSRPRLQDFCTGSNWPASRNASKVSSAPGHLFRSRVCVTYTVLNILADVDKMLAGWKHLCVAEKEGKRPSLSPALPCNFIGLLIRPSESITDETAASFRGDTILFLGPCTN